MSRWQSWMAERMPFRAWLALTGDSQNVDNRQPLADRIQCTEDEATLVSSRVKYDGLAADFFGDNWHMPVLDIDYSAHLVESSTPGHYHLYLNQAIEWNDYKKLLKCMERCGLLQPGFVRNSIRRGASFARLPGVLKGTEHLAEG